MQTKKEIIDTAKKILESDDGVQIVPDPTFSLTQKFYTQKSKELDLAFNYMKVHIYDLSKFYVTPFYIIRTAYAYEYNKEVIQRHIDKNKIHKREGILESVTKDVEEEMQLLLDDCDIRFIIDAKNFQENKTQVNFLGIMWHKKHNMMCSVFYSIEKLQYYYVDLNYFSFVSFSVYKDLIGYNFYFYENKIYITNRNEDFSAFVFCV
jgi:hypothetical protein